MAQTYKLGKTATSVRHENGWTHIRYHSTDVVSFNEKEIILRHGGWRTSTTKTRMNQASAQFNLGYQVYQKNLEWFIIYPIKNERLERYTAKFYQNGVHTISREVPCE